MNSDTKGNVKAIVFMLLCLVLASLAFDEEPNEKYTVTQGEG